MTKSTRKYGKRNGKKNGGEYTKDVFMGENGLDWSKSFTIRRFLRMPNLKTSIVGGEKVLQIYMLVHDVDNKTLTFTFKNCDFDAAALLVNKMRSLFYDIGIELGSNYISKGTAIFTGGWSTENIIVMKYDDDKELTNVSIKKSKGSDDYHEYNSENANNTRLFKDGFKTVQKDFSTKTELAASSFESNFEGLSSGVANVGEGTGQSKSFFTWSTKPKNQNEQPANNEAIPQEQPKRSWLGFGGKSKRRRTSTSKKGSRRARR